jgi:small subunit ribosomal protein S17
MAEPQGNATPANTPVVNTTKNEKIGQVTSTKMAKTIVVEVTRRVPHPLYKRIITKKKKFYAHDEEQTAKVGDIVKILEHRPLSKLKRWALGDIIRRAVQVGVEPSILADPNLVTATAGSKSIKGKQA